MKLEYDAETDIIHIDLLDRAVVDSDEVRPGIVLSMDSGGNLVRVESRTMTVPIENGTVTLTPITAREYSEHWQTAQAIEPDYLWTMKFLGFAARDYPELRSPQLYASLKRMFGETTTMYDDYKCSFGYPFLIHLAKDGGDATYLLLFTDTKRGLWFQYSKIHSSDEIAAKQVDRMRYFTPVPEEFSRDDMQTVSKFFFSSVAESWKTPGSSTEDFVRSIDAMNFVYGFRDGRPFEADYEDPDEYEEAVRKLRNLGIPYNATRPNPPR